MNYSLLKSLIFLLLFGLITANAQTIETSSKVDEYLKKMSLGFFFNAGYSSAISDNTDANGGYFENADVSSDNSFFLRYARINGKYEFSPKWRINLLVNFADFKRLNVSTKVLEIASLTYMHNSYFNVRLGQFRPYFGVEDTYGAAKQKSNYWSNSYILLGRSGWQSFQIGLSIYGNLNASNIPLKYYFNLHNGNGKNQTIDNDNSKNFSTRLESEIVKGVKIAGNYGISDYKNDNTSILSFDLQTDHQLFNNLSLQTESQYAQGHNISELYANNNINTSGFNVDDYKFKTWYIVPQITLKTNKEFLKALEFSCRYEDLTANENINTHSVTTTPQLSFIFEENHNIKASIGAVLNKYENDDDLIDLLPNSDVFYIQLQMNY